ncbi:isoprenylcysteine carboxylmethyltransferase family protein [uncultured Brevundimonas sp.]|uniref:methyltransferase family protein n=1 Tax=uncultured Brevundimonas sp. TaxID=213418 RepID=UPI002639A53F|nr:isoprenylcysteine carboxylmethyltransferase family protein [uncultured Brevundimonas sp.]
MAPVHDTPGIRIPPPLIYLAFLLAGWGVERVVVDWTFGLEETVQRVIALVLVVAGLVLDGMAAGQMRRHNTAVEPWKGATTLLTDGLFAQTRNPIYLGFAVTYAGFAVGMDSPLALGLLVPCLVVMDRLVIPREEAHLKRVFGTPYELYCRKVRRWL